MENERSDDGPTQVSEAKRIRSPWIPTLAVLVVLLSLAGVTAEIWTESLWFSQLGFSEVFRVRLLTQLSIFTVVFLVVASAVWLSMFLAFRMRPVYAAMSMESSSAARYRAALAPVKLQVSLAAAALVATFAGMTSIVHWETVLMWHHQVPFSGDGSTDAQFGHNISFYMFTVPMLQFVLNVVVAACVLSLIAAVVVHYLYGGLRYQGRDTKLERPIRVHLALLLATLPLSRAAKSWLERYETLTEDRGLFVGAGYTAATAEIPAHEIMAGISILVAAFFIAAGFTGGWRLSVVAVATMTVSLVVMTGLYPYAVQQIQVRPTEQAKEQEYLQRNIDATRQAYALTGVEVQRDYEPQVEGERGALRKDAETAASIRLIDPAVVGTVFNQQQRIRQFYRFQEPLDVDRYRINGEMRDTVLGVRELDLSGLSRKRSWVNDHTVYTHGYGIVAAYGNQRAADGSPEFFQKGIVGVNDDKDVETDLGTFEPRIYFGEKSPNYSIVGAPAGAPPAEIDHPGGSVDAEGSESESGQAKFTFSGNGGPKIGSFLNRSLFAMKFRDQNILLSGAINSESQILYDRQPLKRVSKVAPWLTLDSDPYPAVIGDRVKWIVDGYTVSSEYPYSDLQPFGDVTADSQTTQDNVARSLQQRKVNYIRNSVKAVVDAYDGKVDLYEWDKKDPVLQTWMNVFPNTVKPMSEISAELMPHLRYPEDLFKVQREVLARYHVKDANTFYTGQDFWKIPREPTDQATSKEQAQPPYYLTLQMPGQEKPAFSLTSSFIPDSNRGNEASVLAGFLAVDADAGEQAGERAKSYGTMRLLSLKRSTTVQGPGQAQNDFNTDTVALTELNLLERGGSRVKRGNLLTLPVAGGLLYVQPVYVTSSAETSIPLLRKVLVMFGKKVGFANTLDEALNQVFGGDSGAKPKDREPGSGDSSPELTKPSERLSAALQEAQEAVEEGQKALKEGDFAAYGQAQEKLQKALEKAVVADANAQGKPAPTATPSPTGADATASPSATAARPTASASVSVTAQPTSTSGP